MSTDKHVVNKNNSVVKAQIISGTFGEIIARQKSGTEIELGSEGKTVGHLFITSDEYKANKSNKYKGINNNY
jgi:hypothetical protein